MYKPSNSTITATGGVFVFSIVVAVAEDPGNTKLDLPSPVAFTTNVLTTGSTVSSAAVVVDPTTDSVYAAKPRRRPGSVKQST